MNCNKYKLSKDVETSSPRTKRLQTTTPVLSKRDRESIHQNSRLRWPIRPRHNKHRKIEHELRRLEVDRRLT